MDMPPDPEPPGPILYLTSRYPAASHTFILREVAALRRLGLEILTATVRAPSAADLIGPEEAAEHARSFGVLATARNPFRLLSDHVAALLRAPGAYGAALALALRTGRPGLRGLVWQLFYFAEAAPLARHAAKSGARRLHVHFADSPANLGMIAARMAGIRFSFTLHGPAELYEPQSWRLDAKCAAADAVICISHFARSQAMLFADRDAWPKLQIVRCGVEPDRYGSGPAPGGVPLKLLFVGRLTAIKGLFVLTEALARLEAGRVALTLVGDGEDRSALEAEARARGLDVTFLGFRSQSGVAQALAEADALVLPSFGEGLPVVAMEAFAAGRPVIATRVGALEELVENGRSGYVVPPGDAEALADAIARMAAQAPEARAAMGAHGRARVAAEFDVDLQARRLAAIFGARIADRAPGAQDTAAPAREAQRSAG